MATRGSVKLLSRGSGEDLGNCCQRPKAVRQFDSSPSSLEITDLLPNCFKQNRSTEGCSKLKRSVDMTSSGKNGLNISTNASPKWDRTRCPEE